MRKELVKDSREYKAAMELEKHLIICALTTRCSLNQSGVCIRRCNRIYSDLSRSASFGWPMKTIAT